MWPGPRPDVWVEDQNRNQPGTWDAVSVEMRSPATGDLEMLQLQETTRDSGLFHGTIELALTSFVRRRQAVRHAGQPDRGEPSGLGWLHGLLGGGRHHRLLPGIHR